MPDPSRPTSSRPDPEPRPLHPEKPGSVADNGLPPASLFPKSGPTGEELLFARIMAAAADAERPLSGLRAAAVLLCSRPPAIGAEVHASIFERAEIFLREGDESDAPDTETDAGAGDGTDVESGPDHSWITLGGPAPGGDTPPPPREARGPAGLLKPRRPAFLFLLVLLAAAAYMAGSRGCIPLP